VLDRLESCILNSGARGIVSRDEDGGGKRKGY
jgi:hypothetical protein